jgi:hypothetical protein
MKGNDLSNAPVPRVAICFEGALAFWPTDARGFRRWERAIDRGNYAEAVGMMEFNESLMTIIWDRSWRKSMTIDVVTFIDDPGWEQEVKAAVRRQELPIHNVWATTPQKLGRKLASMYDLMRIYTPFEEHLLMFGATKCVYLTNPNQIGT